MGYPSGWRQIHYDSAWGGWFAGTEDICHPEFFGRAEAAGAGGEAVISATISVGAPLVGAQNRTDKMPRAGTRPAPTLNEILGAFKMIGIA